MSKFAWYFSPQGKIELRQRCLRDGVGLIEVLVLVAFLAIFGLIIYTQWGALKQPLPHAPLVEQNQKESFFEKGAVPITPVVKQIKQFRVEYNSFAAPLTQARIKELDQAVAKFSAQQGHFLNSAQPLKQARFFKPALAQTALEDLVIEPQGSSYAAALRRAFAENKLLWTPEEMQRLAKIKVVDSLGGNLGMYDYARIFDADNNFVDWIGIIYIKAYTGNEMTLAHEYGHHFTNFWAARRTQGKWGNWPADEAGDYYQLRPLPESCHCPDYGCPYYQRDWEILAEDFRETVTAFASQHMFANATCPENGGTLGEPDQAKVAAYLRALPFSLVTPSPSPIPTTIFRPLATPPSRR